MQVEKTVAKIDLLLFNGNGNYSKSGKSRNKSPSQAALKKAAGRVNIMSEQTPDESYMLAKQFTKGVANEKNYMNNSVGFWSLKKSAPKRDADYTSKNRKTGEISSRYWYTKEGVYRQSDHWGSNIASCSWYIKGRSYKTGSLQIGEKETAFISWKNLKAKGVIGYHKKKDEYFLSGFKFQK